MSIFTKYIDKTFYPDFQDSWDNYIFKDIAEKYLSKESVLLDAGAGSGYLPQMNFKEKVKKAIGVDPSEEVKNNPFLHESYISFCDDMHFLASNSIDVAVSNNVLEHVENPNAFLLEVNRVLKNNGYFIVKTPNKSHYMTLIARFSPTGFHKLYNVLRGRPSENTFKTHYNINSKKELYTIANKCGFEVVDFRLIEGRPEYLRIIAPLYVLGLIYERIVNFFNLSSLKIVYFATLKKKAN